MFNKKLEQENKELREVIDKQTKMLTEQDAMLNRMNEVYKKQSKLLADTTNAFMVTKKGMNVSMETILAFEGKLDMEQTLGTGLRMFSYAMMCESLGMRLLSEIVVDCICSQAADGEDVSCIERTIQVFNWFKDPIQMPYNFEEKQPGVKNFYYRPLVEIYKRFINDAGMSPVGEDGYFNYIKNYIKTGVPFEPDIEYEDLFDKYDFYDDMAYIFGMIYKTCPNYEAFQYQMGRFIFGENYEYHDTHERYGCFDAYHEQEDEADDETEA